MKIYALRVKMSEDDLVRYIKSMAKKKVDSALGLILCAAKSPSELWWLVDEFDDPGRYEYKEIRRGTPAIWIQVYPEFDHEFYEHELFSGDVTTDINPFAGHWENEISQTLRDEVNLLSGDFWHELAEARND